MEHKKSKILLILNRLAYTIMIGTIIQGIVSTHKYWEYDIVGTLLLLSAYIIYLGLYVIDIKVLNKVLTN